MAGILNRIKYKKDDETKFSSDDTAQIFQVIDSMGRLHSSGFDLFGAVYEMFASNKEKSDFGEFFTRRHYTHILSKLLLKEETRTPTESKITILDPACGTGGFLTEAFKVLRSRYTELGYEQTDFMPYLKSSCLYGFDVKPENVSRSKLNMFLVGDGQVLISQKNTLTSIIDTKFKYVLSNPPMGKGVVRADMKNSNSKRMEIGFMFKIINLLEVDGKACVIMPDGFLENPSFAVVREEMLEKCIVEAVISLPRFAFAPYTKEKTFAIYLKKKPAKQTQLQLQSIWMYIIDNDGYANSDRRFPTALRSENNAWMHDEISSWVDKNGEEKTGLLEERWMRFDDVVTNGTEWIDENGKTILARKGGVISIKSINASNYFNIMPEFHLGRFNNLKADAVKADSLAYDTIEEMLVKLKDLELAHKPESLVEKMTQYSFEELFGSAMKGQQKLTEEAIYN